ncbi:MAG: CTP synthase [Candidatus Diapherotrites archaeon]|nr:CTP synthase [Candidatus Diapherotrites archaeon]
MSDRAKFVVVTGGVISGLGKGVVTASLANLIQAQGFNVSIVKIDPYLNVDAGTMRPTEHGEVFVTGDGGETDQDIGTYERFLGKDLSKRHNITTGQVYLSVIGKERNLEFDGKCVEVIPHIPQEVQRRLMQVAKEDDADFVLVEIGGTVGDYQNVLFLEAVREMHLKGLPVVFVHVVYLPVPLNLGEMKTKPAQHSVRELNSVGIQPDFVVCRSEKPIDSVRREKISLFCNTLPENVISAPNLKSVYEEPLVFEEQTFVSKILLRFGKKYRPGAKAMSEWRGFVKRVLDAPKKVRIGIVGKYFDIGDFTLEDSYISVIEAVKHAAAANNCKAEIVWIDSKRFEKEPSTLAELKQFDGIIVPGGFGSSGVEGKISAIRFCRENGVPFLGLCYGLQLAVIEFARTVCAMPGANTTEIDPNTKFPVIDIMPEQKTLLEKRDYGATMRLGAYPAKLKKGSAVWELYSKKETVEERHRHRFEVNPEFVETLERHGLLFSGVSPDRKLMEFLELPKHRFFMATQSHPEFTSKPLRPNPLYLGFVSACLKK